MIWVLLAVIVALIMYAREGKQANEAGLEKQKQKLRKKMLDKSE